MQEVSSSSWLQLVDTQDNGPWRRPWQSRWTVSCPNIVLSVLQRCTPCVHSHPTYMSYSKHNSPLYKYLFCVSFFFCRVHIRLKLLDSPILIFYLALYITNVTNRQPKHCELLMFSFDIASFQKEEAFWFVHISNQNSKLKPCSCLNDNAS